MKPETNTIFIGDPLEILQKVDEQQFDLIFFDTPLYGGYLFDLNDPKPPPYQTFEEYLTYAVDIIFHSHRTLKQTGSILVRISPLSPFNPKLFLDRFFGKQNFRGEIIWENQATKHNPKSTPYINFEILLLYSKSENYIYNEQFIELSQNEIKQQYRYHDSRGFYKLWKLTDQLDRPERVFEWKGIKPLPGQSWKYSKERLDKFDANGEIEKTGNFPKRKVYFSETESLSPLGFVWSNFPRLKGLEKALVDVRFQRAIEMVSSKDSKIFDPFITPISLGTLIQTGRSWVGVSQFEIISKEFPQLKGQSITEIKQSAIQKFEQVGLQILPEHIRRLIASEAQVVNPQKIIESAGQKYAFLVGINHYMDGIGNLNYCTNDVVKLDETLKKLGYQVVTLHDDSEAENLIPLRSNIETEIDILVENLQPEDTLYVHFSCHGTIVDTESMLIASDTRALRLKNSSLPVNKIINLMKGGRAKKLVLSLDVCHAGIEMGRALMDQEFIKNVYDSAEGFHLLAASTAQQQAYELPDLQHGLFSYYLIQGFSGEADYDVDGRITVEDLRNYTLDQIHRWNAQNGKRQEPTFRSEGIGEITLVHPR